MSEQQAPAMETMVAAADKCFSIEDLQDMERQVPKLLNFNLNLPTRDYFGGRLLLAAEATERETAFVYMLLELSLLVSSL